MSKLLPRLGLVLPPDTRGARVGVQVVSKELLAAPTVDIIMVASLDRARTLTDTVAPQTLDPLRPADYLQKARAEGTFPLLSPGDGESPLEAAARFVSENTIDGYVVLEPLAEQPCLRLRSKVQVLQPFPGASLRWLLDELPAAELARTLQRASELLRRLGIARPRLVAFDVEGSSRIKEALELARASGVDVSGPHSPRVAVGQPGDALVAFTPAQLELPLLLQGTGLETSLALDAPCAWPSAWPTGTGARAAVLAVDRLLKLLPAAESALAAEREEARKPSVSIAPKTSATSPDRDRCPYCHLRLAESPDGSGSRPGPPVSCSECGTAHHRDCATEHGRCTTFGCLGTRMLRLGVAIPVSRLGGESPREHPFVTLDGDTRLGPQWLRVEAPIDDPDARPTRRRLSLELASAQVRRGTVLEGYVVVWAPRPFRVRGGALKLRASLTTRKLSGNKAVRTEPILGRQASFVGAAPAGTLGRLQDGVVSLFGKGTGVAIPAGVRRYPFSFLVDGEHPASVHNRMLEVEETVSTRLEAFLDTDSSEVALEVK